MEKEKNGKKGIWKKILLLIIVVYVVIFIRNFYIVDKIVKGKEVYLNSDNYHVQIVENGVEKDIFYKNGILKQEIKVNHVTQFLIWSDQQEGKVYVLFPQTQLLSIEERKEGDPLKDYSLKSPLDQFTLGEKIQVSALSWITESKKQYHLYFINGANLVVEKETLLPKEMQGVMLLASDRYLYSENPSKVRYEIIEFNTVTEEQIRKPNTNGYTLQ